MSKRVTLADVARRAGLSPTTVSMVLNDRPNARIPSETAERVRQAADELNYVPDATARELRTGRTQTIGFLSDEVTLTRYASAMIRGILDAGDARDQVVVMAEADQHWSRLERAIALLRSRRVDGLLFGLMRARLVELPGLDGSLPGLIINGRAEGLRSVLPDEYQAGRAAVAHLVAHGHRRIAFIGRSPSHLDPAVSVTIGRRLAGIDEGMAEAGLRFVDEAPGHDWEPDLGYAGASAILQRSPQVTAILAANDRIAFGVYQAAQAAGRSLPDELSVMSFDDEQLAGYLRPGVTTMQLPYLAMGRAGMELILDGDLTGPEVLVPMPLIERDSVRPAAD